MKNKSGAPLFLELAQQIEADWIAARREVGPSLTGELSVTGQPYVTLVSDAPRLDEDQAYLGGLGVFERYARGRQGALYWHSFPTIERVRQGRNWGYRVTLRLLISDNPVVSRLVEDAKMMAAE